MFTASRFAPLLVILSLERVTGGESLGSVCLMEGFLTAVQVPRLNCAKRIVGGFLGRA